MARWHSTETRKLLWIYPSPDFPHLPNLGLRHSIAGQIQRWFTALRPVPQCYRPPSALIALMNRPTTAKSLRYAIGGDHAGFDLKREVTELLGKLNVEFVDCGAFDNKPSDFPDFAKAVAEKIIAGEVNRGILVCGSGVGVSVAANKFPGIRASLCHDTYSARQGVEHDDMNVLCVGARVIGPEVAFEIIKAFVGARYTPQERHAKRLEKILEFERQMMTSSQRSE